MDISLIIKGIIVAASALVGIASYKYFNLPEDNIFEELAEDVIMIQTGKDIDFSPLSPEMTGKELAEMLPDDVEF